MVLGSLGIMGAIQAPFLPQLLSAQLRMLSQSIRPGSGMPATVMIQQFMAKLVDAATVNAPPWFESWLVGVAVAGVVVFSAYIYGSACVFNMKPQGVRWFTWATFAAAALQFTQAIGTTVAMPILGLFIVPSMAFGLAVYVVLLIVVKVKSKKGLVQPPPLPGRPCA